MGMEAENIYFDPSLWKQRVTRIIIMQFCKQLKNISYPNGLVELLYSLVLGAKPACRPRHVRSLPYVGNLKTNIDIII